VLLLDKESKHIDLFTDDSLDMNHLAAADLTLHKYSEFETFVKSKQFSSVAIDTLSCSHRDFSLFKDCAGSVIEYSKAVDLPITHLKVHKNSVELEGTEKALLLESAALVSFYAEVEHILNSGRVLWEHEGE